MPGDHKSTYLKMLALSVMLIVISISRAHGQSASADRLQQRQIERRAVEAAIWGMPAVNTDLML